MFTTGQKIRLFIYIIIVIVLFFSFPIINQAINEKTNASPVTPKATQTLEAIKVLSSKNITLFSDRGSNVWLPVEKLSQIKTDSNLASLGENSRLLVKTPDDLIIGLGGNAKISVSKYSDGNFLIDSYYGCFGLKVNDPVGKDVNISFLSGLKKIRIITQNIFCKNNPDEELIESQTDIFINKDVNIATQPKLKNIFPCNDIVEVNDSGGSTASIILKFVAPLMTNKSVFISTNAEFTDNVFTTKTYSTETKTSPLGKGHYFWRVKNESNGELSEACSFEIVYHGDINLVLPKTDEVISDKSIDFSWNKISGVNKYTVVITKDFSKTIQRIDVESNNTKLDDPLQTLGPGSYYWRVETKNGKISPYRRFYVYTSNDLVVDSPRYEDVFKPADKFFIISWNPLPMVKSYSVVISANPSFVNSEYVNTTTQPFVFIESMKEGKYYLRVSAVFNNDAKIITDVIPFNIYDIPEIVILDPSPGSSRDVSTEKNTKILWKPVENASEYTIVVNEDQPIKISADKAEKIIPVALGGNRVQVEAYCGTGAQRRLCAKGKAIEFFINNIIEPPTAPKIKYPYNRKVFIGGQVSMEWSSAKGADGYKIEISKDKGFVDVKETEMQNAKFNVQLKRGIYYWRVYSYMEKTGSKIYSKPTEIRLFIVK
ncbi:MAG: hypothetical protein NTY22_01740 [Proteobacteria bacterium]|nr:hypothetical protein [Pseudomonadota bacterium]